MGMNMTGGATRRHCNGFVLTRLSDFDIIHKDRDVRVRRYLSFYIWNMKEVQTDEKNRS